jgi:predicted peptidase
LLMRLPLGRELEAERLRPPDQVRGPRNDGLLTAFVLDNANKISSRKGALMRIGQHPYSSKIQTQTASNLARTVELNYLLYLPGDYGKDPQEKWPLILFLHGSGERGSDLEILKRQPLPKTLDRGKNFPFIVLSPQLPLEMGNWSPLIDPIKVLFDQIEVGYLVDNRRVYLTGLSMGGFGTWEFALRYPRRFAAIVPIAGGYRYQSKEIPENICDLTDLPVWVFHGARDMTVLPSQSEDMVEALKACGGNVKFTLYSDADHGDSWTRAYADPDLYKWLLEQWL